MKTNPVVVALACLCLAGCAGTRFTRLTGDELKLGTEKLQTVREKLGKPYQEATVIKNGKTVKVLSYSYARASVSSSFGGAVPGRTQSFYFLDGILVGHLFISTYENDRTSFDSSVAEKIKKGETRIEQVTAWLGSPDGEYIYPLVEKENEKALVYSYVQVRSKMVKLGIYQQILTAAYDPSSGVVTKLEFVESGEK